MRSKDGDAAEGRPFPSHPQLNAAPPRHPTLWCDSFQSPSACFRSTFKNMPLCPARVAMSSADRVSPPALIAGEINNGRTSTSTLRIFTKPPPNTARLRRARRDLRCGSLPRFLTAWVHLTGKKRLDTFPYRHVLCSHGTSGD